MSTDTGWYLAGVLGFALVCVLTVVWWLSKRTVHVHQENHNTAAPHVETSPASGGGIAPMLIGGIFALLVAGIVISALLSAAQSAITSIDRALNPAVPIPARMPTANPEGVRADTIVPTTIAPMAVRPTVAPTEQPIVIAPQPAQATNVWPLVIGALLTAAVGVWGYAGVMLIDRRRKNRQVMRYRNTTPSPAAPASSGKQDGRRPTVTQDVRDRVDERLRQRRLENDLERTIPSIVLDLDEKAD